MKPSTSHQSSNNHRLATSSLTLLASCAASSTASRCCAVLWPGNQSGHAKIPAPEFGEVVHQEANDRPPAPHMFLNHHRRPPRDPRWVDGWMLKACDGRRCASRSIHPKSAQLLPRFPLKGTPMATGDTSAAVASQPYLAIADCLLLLRRIMQSLHNMF